MEKMISFLVVLQIMVCKAQATNDTIIVTYNYKKAYNKSIQALDRLYDYAHKIKDGNFITNDYNSSDLEVFPIPILKFKKTSEEFNCDKNIEQFIDFEIDYSKLMVFVLHKKKVIGSFKYSKTANGLEYPSEALGLFSNPGLFSACAYNELYRLGTQGHTIFMLEEVDEFLIVNSNRLYITDDLDDDQIKTVDRYFCRYNNDYAKDLIYGGIVLGKEYQRQPLKKDKENKTYIWVESPTSFEME